MARFFAFIVARRELVLALAVLLAIGGTINLTGLSIDAVPDISPKQVMILTQAKGLGPLEVERLVTFPLENTMAGTPNVKSIRSTSRYGISAVYVTFQDGVPVETARALVAERLPAAIATMPPGVGTPNMGPVATGLGEVYQFELRGPGYTPMQLHRILEWQIAPKLKLVSGVTDVNIYGGQLETYEVRVLADSLRRYKITLAQVFDAVANNNETRGGAYIDRDQEQEVVRGIGLVSKIETLGEIVLATGPGGVPVKVSDVGTVVRAPMVRLGAVSHDGVGETVVGVVLMLYGDNASDVVGNIKTAVEKIQASLPPGVAIRPYYDRSALVDRTIKTVEHNLLQGACLVGFVLLVMLGNWRAALIVAAAIPLSMLVAFAGMRFFGISANLMSLGAIDFGLIVDGAVVMVDNVLSRSGGARDSFRDTVATAAAEVARPVFFAVLIIVIVYVPVLSLQDVAGKMFKPMAETVILALLGSLALTMTVMPALAATALKPDEKGGAETFAVRWLRRGYTPVLRTCTAHSYIVSIAALALFGVSAFLAMGLGGEFIPQLSEGSIVVTSEKLPGINLEASMNTVQSIEKVVRGFAEVKHVVSLTGSAAIPTDPMGVESSDSFIALSAPSTWKGSIHTQDELVGAIGDKLKEEVPGVAFTFSQPIQMRMNDLLQGVKADIAVMVYGDDLATLRKIADDVVKIVSGIKGADDVKPEAQAGMPYLTIEVDRAAIARYGMNAKTVLDAVDAIGGHPSGMVYGDDNSETPIMVRWPPGDRDDIDKIRNLPVFDGSGRVVPLSSVAKISVGSGPAQISREALQRRTYVEINLRGRDAASFVKEAKVRIAKAVQLPPRYSIEWSGQYQNMQTADARLSFVVPIAMAAILLLLYFMFDDVRLTLLVFLLVPVSASGGILALVARGLPFSISAAIGFIATFGIATLNGVVLVSYLKDERDAGATAVEAAKEAAERRMRPVLMTAFVATLGFLPMAVSTGAGAEVQRPLATVVIGGLITATILTLLVLPSIYPIADRLFRSGGRRAETARAEHDLKNAAE